MVPEDPSPRKLPRAPAIFDRKTKWRKIEPWRDFFSDEIHGGWQTNYPSLQEHEEPQFEAEEAEGLMTRTTLRDAINKYGEWFGSSSTPPTGC